MVIMLVGIVGMSIFGVIGFHSWWHTAIAIVGLILGYFLRRQIVDIFEWTTWALPTALFIYGVLLFVGERLGLSRPAQLIAITLTTVTVFALQFWSLSDPSIVRLTDE